MSQIEAQLARLGLALPDPPVPIANFLPFHVSGGLAFLAGQVNEWNANAELDWGLLEQGPFHRGLQRFVEDLNRLYVAEAALRQTDYDADGFAWIDCSDQEQSVLSFVRKDRAGTRPVVVVMNLTWPPPPMVASSTL